MLRKWQSCLLPPSATAWPSLPLLEWLGREAGCTFRLHQAWPGVCIRSWKEVVAEGIGEGEGASQGQGSWSCFILLPPCRWQGESSLSLWALLHAG